jgi:N-acetylglucosamine kinase-like BadF-type ATPase
VDGGQSSTAALIGDETGRVLGRGHSGSCKDAASIQSALQQAGALGARFEAACFGLSGGPADQEALARELVIAERYLFTHDAQIALTGATAGEPGIITIAGTGSIAFGRNPEGRTARTGGWGYLFGDEGGGFDIVRQALRAVLRSEEGWGPPTALRAALLDATGARSAHDLMHDSYTTEFSRERFASFAKLVDDVAQAGDQVARDILTAAAQSLAIFTAAVRAQLFQEEEPVQISYAGGVFKSALVLERFRIIVELEDGTRVVPPRYGPPAGALIEAYRLAGIEPSLSGIQGET